MLPVALIAAIAGCSSGNKLVGTWTNKTDEYVQKLKDDGTFESTYPLNSNTIHLFGTYTYVGTELSITPTSYKADGPPLSPEIAQSFEKKLNKPVKSQISWEDNDTYVLKLDGGSFVTMTRQK